MLAFAVIGLAANVVGLLILRSGARDSLERPRRLPQGTRRHARLVAVIVAAVVIAATGWLRMDVVASVAVALMILPGPGPCSGRQSTSCWRRAPREASTSPTYASTSSRPRASSVRTTCTPGPSPRGCPCCRCTSSSPTRPSDGRRCEGPRRSRQAAWPTTFRRRPLHLPARTCRSPGARVPPARVSQYPATAGPPDCDGLSLVLDGLSQLGEGCAPGAVGGLVDLAGGEEPVEHLLRWLRDPGRAFTAKRVAGSSWPRSTPRSGEPASLSPAPCPTGSDADRSSSPGKLLLAAIGDVAHPTWRARSVGIYRLWRRRTRRRRPALRARRRRLGYPQRDLDRHRPHRRRRTPRRRQDVPNSAPRTPPLRPPDRRPDVRRPRRIDRWPGRLPPRPRR